MKVVSIKALQSKDTLALRKQLLNTKSSLSLVRRLLNTDLFGI